MGQIIRTEAVVLRNMDYRETSQIVTLFTREKGKLAVLAKGARLSKSQFGATLQPMSHIQAIIYHKPTRDIQTLGESSHISLFNRIGAGLEKLTIGVRVIELVQALLQVEERNEEVFFLVLDTLHRLDQAQIHTENIWPYFQIRLSASLGFQPFIDRQSVASVEDRGGYLALETGAVSNDPKMEKQVVHASRTALRAFAILVRSDIETVLRMQLEGSVLQEVSGLIDKYLRYHVGEALPARTHRVIAQMLDSRNTV